MNCEVAEQVKAPLMLSAPAVEYVPLVRVNVVAVRVPAPWVIVPDDLSMLTMPTVPVPVMD